MLIQMSGLGRPYNLSEQGGREAIIILYDPNEIEEFCKIHATGLFDEVYGSILNDTRQNPKKKRKELQRVRTVALMHSLSFYRNQVFTFLQYFNQK